MLSPHRPYHSQHFAGDQRQFAVLHLTSMLFAAHTNTTTTTGWLLARLSEHPAVLARLVAEQEAVVREAGSELTLETMARMPLLDACFRETLREVGALVF